MNEDPSDRLARYQREMADRDLTARQRPDPELPEEYVPAEERRHREYMQALARIAAALEALARQP